MRILYNRAGLELIAERAAEALSAALAQYREDGRTTAAEPQRRTCDACSYFSGRAPELPELGPEMLRERRTCSSLAVHYWNGAIVLHKWNGSGYDAPQLETPPAN